MFPPPPPPPQKKKKKKKNQTHTKLKRNRGKENMRTFSGQAPFASDKHMYNVNKRSPEWNLIFVTCVCCSGLLWNPGEDRGNMGHGANWVTAVLLCKYLCLLSSISFLPRYPRAVCTAESIFCTCTFTVLNL